MLEMRGTLQQQQNPKNKRVRKLKVKESKCHKKKPKLRTKFNWGVLFWCICSIQRTKRCKACCCDGFPQLGSQRLRSGAEKSER